MMYEYEVGLSFAGEDRGFAEAIADGLTKSGVNVFYDDYYAADLWGQDLSVKLRDVYHRSSQFCIMIISEHYVKKMWPSHERQQAIERMIQQQGKAYILPVRLDGYTGEVPGMSGAISYLAVSSSDPEVVVDAFLTKVGRKTGRTQQQKPAEPPYKPQFPKLKKSYTDKEKNDFLKASFTEIVNLIDGNASATKQEHPQFDHDTERITTRKALFYNSVYRQMSAYIHGSAWSLRRQLSYSRDHYHPRAVLIDISSMIRTMAAVWVEWATFCCEELGWGLQNTMIFVQETVSDLDKKHFG